jgi:tetratricopeptide (TPR) repeat protein
MPPNIREVIVARLGRLSEAAGALLVAGAVLGRTCSFEQLCQVAGMDELASLATLDELIKSQLLLETTDSHRPYTFAHDKIRDVVYTEAGDARRRVYHRRAFTLLQTAAAPAAELAHHALVARLLEPAFSYNIAAGDDAANVYAHAEAISHYRRALNLVTQQEDGNVTQNVASETELTQLYLRLGRTLELISQYEQALATYETMEQRAQLRGDQKTQLAALMARITPLATVTAVFNPAQADLLARRALAVAQTLGDQSAEAQILWNQLIIYRNSNQFPQAIACGERALTQARQLNLRQQIAFILNDLGYCYAFMGHFRQAKSLFYEVSHLWRALGNQPMLGDSLTGACLAHVFTGEYDAAIACFEEALQISQTIGTAWALAGCRHNIGFAYGDRGEMERAIAEMEESIRLSELAGFISPLIVVRADLATIYSALGVFERGLETARQAVDVAESKMPIFRVYPLAVLAHLHLLQGHLAEAETLVGQMRTDPHREGMGFYPVLMLLAEAELALAQGNYEQAQPLAEAAEVTARQLELRPYVVTALQLQGQALLGAGQPGVARERWWTACSEAEAIGARRRLWAILFALSQLETDPTVAHRLRQQAHDVIAYIAAHTPPELQKTFLPLTWKGMA